jgi:hypothetical protein
VGLLTRRIVVWSIPSFLTLHNIEEAVGFRAYCSGGVLALPRIAAFDGRLTCATLVQALAALSVLAFLLAAAVSMRPRSRRLLWLLFALESAVALNVLAHVVAAALVFRGYGPGLLTALFVNAPFAFYCFARAKREHWLSRRALYATLPAALVLHGPVLAFGLWLAARLTA